MTIAEGKRNNDLAIRRLLRFFFILAVSIQFPKCQPWHQVIKITWRCVEKTVRPVFALLKLLLGKLKIMESKFSQLCYNLIQLE